MQKDFWRSSSVAVIGGGKWGTVLADLASRNCAEVRLFVRAEDRARQLNATRSGSDLFPDFELNGRVRAIAEPERIFEVPVSVVIWALPSEVCREQARRFAPMLSGAELIIHATKGLEQKTLKRISQVLSEELPTPRIGVISGPNLAAEIASHQPAATVVASRFDEVIQAGQALFEQRRFHVEGSRDVIGVEWAGVLKNVLAIASGWVAGMGMGWNTRAWVISRGLQEMLQFTRALGAEADTFLGLAGIGDVIATCSSELSRNFRLGSRLAQGVSIEQIREELGETAEGVQTTLGIGEFVMARGLKLPLLSALNTLLRENNPGPLRELLKLE